MANFGGEVRTAIHDLSLSKLALVNTQKVTSCFSSKSLLRLGALAVSFKIYPLEEQCLVLRRHAVKCLPNE